MQIKFAAAQIEIVGGRPDLNIRKALQAVEEAKAKGIDILLLPELCLSGAIIGDLWEQTAFLKDCASYGEELIAASQGICLIFGNIALDPAKVNEDGRIRKYNAAFIAQDGKLIPGAIPQHPYVIKYALPDYRLFEDSRYFHSLFKLQPELNPPLSIPEILQPVTVDIRGEKVKLGILIAEDGWAENYFYDVAKILSGNGAQILCNISSSPFTLNKNHKRQKVFSAQVKECGIPLIYCNHIGIQNSGKNVFTYDGCSCAYSANGILLASGERFRELLLPVDFYTETGAISSTYGIEAPMSETAEIYTALHYGAAGFLHQMNISKMTIGISGGIDSAVSAAFYINILGPENVLLVNMPSQYNSSLTKNLAKQMAEALGTNYTIMPIDESVEMSRKQLTETPIHSYLHDKDFRLELTPLAMENIQARDRGARIIAGLSSAWGGAFSCNSNKTELTVGYATFYGDISGALAILGDLWKYQVYALGHYLNEVIFQKEVIAGEVFRIAPSAELSSSQTVGTGGDPLVYPYHDYLFRSFIEKWDKVSPEDILRWYQEGCLEEKIGCEKGIVARLFPTAEAFIADLERWWKLFCGFAVAKRIQAPPVMSITKRSYGNDHREAQLSPYYSRGYYELKNFLLKNN